MTVVSGTSSVGKESAMRVHLSGGRALLIAAGILVLTSSLLPLWGMTMLAPQYPDGLLVHVYPGSLRGDLSIVNVLNHYVGMGSLEIEHFPQVKALPYLLWFVGIGLLLSGILAGRRLALSMITLIGLTGILGTAELYRNLVQFGTTLDPKAPLELEPFVPPIIGEYHVWNFTVHQGLMVGSYLLVIAAIVAWVGYSRLPRAAYRTGGRSGPRGGRFTLIGCALAVGLTVGIPFGGVALADEGERSLPGPGEIILSEESGLSLAEALRRVAPGGVVRVKSGVYSGPIVVDRGVQLIAEGKAIILGAGELVTVRGGSTLAGFEIQHTGTLVRSDEAAVRVLERGSVVRENTVTVETAHGIYLERGGEHHIKANRVNGSSSRRDDDRGNGIYLFDTEGNLVEGNEIRYVRDGIYFSFVRGDVVRENDIRFSRYGVHSMYSNDVRFEANRLQSNTVGSAFMYSRGMEMKRNLVVDHGGQRGYGILLKDADGNHLSENYVVGNTFGLFADLADNNDVDRNVFAANATAFWVFSSSSRNSVWANSFVGNRIDTLLNPGRHTTAWFDEREGGNYWDRYRGIDMDGNGFGAVAHTSGDPFGSLTQQHPELRAFYLGPAVQALEWAEQAFPLLRVPRAIDERPRVKPVSGPLPRLRSMLRTGAASSDSASTTAVVPALLLLGGGVLLAGRIPRKRSEREG